MHLSIGSAQSTLTYYVQHDLVDDVLAGLTGATAGAPQAMAFAIVAGISPVYGLYTAIVSTIVSGVTGTSTFMTTGPTNALAVVVGSSLAPFAGSGDIVARLITLTFLVGVIQVVMGLLRLGDLTRFVAGSVMTGFVTGAALLVLLGQLGHLTGVPTGSHALILPRIADMVFHVAQIHVPTFFVGIVTILIIVYLHKTRLVSFATLVAIVITGIGIALTHGDGHGIELVRDLSPIPNTLPGLRLPEPGLMQETVLAALALAVLGLVQTAALAQGIDEPDDRIPDASREFVSQGLGNLLGGLFQGMPAGGSLSRTAVNIKAGAHTRWANIWAGLFVALIMVLLGRFAERIALAALAGHLVVAATTLISPPRIRFVWDASWTGRWAMTATFVSTLVFPLQYSVYVGIVLSLVLYIHQSSRLLVICLEPVGTNLFREAPLPTILPDNEPTIISVSGHLYFAAMRDLEHRLPKPNGSKHPVVILRLRGDTLLAGTGASMLVTYAQRLRASGGRLILCGVEDAVFETLLHTGALSQIGEENVFHAEDMLLSSLQRALDHAYLWLEGFPTEPVA